MAQTLKSRVVRIVAAGVQALIDQIEDKAPLAVLQEFTRELEDVINDVRIELGKVAANHHLVQKQYTNLNLEHDRLSEQMTTAVAQNRDDLLQTAIGRQLDIEAQLPILEGNQADLMQQEKELQNFIEALLSKQREMRHAILAYEQANKAARQETTATSNGARHLNHKAQSITEAFDYTYARQTGLSAIEKQATIAQNAGIQELHQLARDHQIAQRMAKLKEKN